MHDPWPWSARGSQGPAPSESASRRVWLLRNGGDGAGRPASESRQIAAGGRVGHTQPHGPRPRMPQPAAWWGHPLSSWCREPRAVAGQGRRQGSACGQEGVAGATHRAGIQHEPQQGRPQHALPARVGSLLQHLHTPGAAPQCLNDACKRSWQPPAATRQRRPAAALQPSARASSGAEAGRLQARGHEKLRSPSPSPLRIF